MIKFYLAPVIDVPHVINSDFVLQASYSRVVARYVEIATGVTFELGDDSDLEIA